MREGREKEGLWVVRKRSSLYNGAMANGEEDLREKNRGREIVNEKRYTRWSSRLGRDDAEMLVEKAYRRDGKKHKDIYGED